jgi:hypothetical protein
MIFYYFYSKLIKNNLMRKFTFLFAFVLLAFGYGYSQATFIVTSPTNNATSSFRLPNGTSAAAYFRGATLVRTSELTSIPVSTTLTSVGFTTTTGASSACTGNFTLYLQNTGDATFNKGTTWSGVTPGMTVVYTGTMTVPASATTIDLPLTTPFTYLGSGMYVAYEFVSTGPYATSGAIWASNNSLASGCISGTSSTSLAATCVTSSFRPCVRFGYPNSLTNDVSVEMVYGLGTVPAVLGGASGYSAVVRNNSAGPLSNINVSLNMTGANTLTDMQTVSSLGAGSTATVNFTPWVPAALGTGTVNVSVPGDQNNANNSKDFFMTTTCNTGGQNENPIAFPQSVGFNTGSGIITTQVQLPVSATVTGANLAISGNTAAVGNSVYAAMLDNTGTILATSNTLIISNGDLNTKPVFNFTSSVPVTAGQIWHIGMAQTQNSVTGYFPVAAYASPAIPMVYNTVALTGGTLTPLTTNLGIFGFEANFAGSCVGLGVENTGLSPVDGMVIYPNPASSAVHVKLSSVTDKATVSVYNAIGQLVIPAREINGDSADLNVSALAKGVYIVKVVNGKEEKNTKIVIER